MKKRSLFFNFFTSITLCAAIPMVIIVVLLSFELMRYSEDEISRSYIGKLKVASNITEMLSEDIYMDALRITLDGGLDSLSGIRNYDDILDDPDGISFFYQLQDAIENLAGANNILHSIYLVPEGADFVVSSNKNISKLSDFYDKDWINDYLEFRDYRSKPGWMLTRSIGRTERVITFFYMFTPYATTVDGTMIFNLRESELRDLINTNSVLSEGYIIIVDQEGNVISHIDEEKIGHRLQDGYTNDILGSEDTEGYIVNYSGDEKQLITYYRDELNNWTYIGIFPMAVLMGKMNNVVLKVFILCSILIVVGTAASYIVSRRIAAPLKKLVNDIKEKSSLYAKCVDNEDTDNETVILSNAFDALVKEGDRLCALVERNKKEKDAAKQSMEPNISEYDHRLNKSYFEIALDYINKNYKKDIDINIIADHVGISYSHMRKVFKDETGDNITNYLNRMRIDESKELLKRSGMTVRDIALKIGYNNEQSYIRFFKKYMNISPGEYRLALKISSMISNDEARAEAASAASATSTSAAPTIPASMAPASIPEKSAGTSSENMPGVVKRTAAKNKDNL